MKSVISSIGFMVMAASLAACTTTEPTTVAAAEPAGNVKIVGKTGTTRNTNEEGEEIICKRQYATGSRVKFNEVCGTAEEWDALADANKKQLKDMTGDRAFSSE